jgi:hypothetical protein
MDEGKGSSRDTGIHSGGSYKVIHKRTVFQRVHSRVETLPNKKVPRKGGIMEIA